MYYVAVYRHNWAYILKVQPERGCYNGVLKSSLALFAAAGLDCSFYGLSMLSSSDDVIHISFDFA